MNELSAQIHCQPSKYRNHIQNDKVTGSLTNSVNTSSQTGLDSLKCTRCLAKVTKKRMCICWFRSGTPYQRSAVVKVGQRKDYQKPSLPIADPEQR